MGHQAKLLYDVLPTAEELEERQKRNRPMTSKQAKKAYKERMDRNKPTEEQLRELHAELRREDEELRRMEQLERQKRLRQAKKMKLKAAKDAQTCEPGPVKSRWAVDEPKARITDFFKKNT